MAVIEVTAAAAERIRELLEKDDKLATHSLRMKVIGGGCSGLRYELAFDDQNNDADYARYHNTASGGPTETNAQGKFGLGVRVLPNRVPIIY